MKTFNVTKRVSKQARQMCEKIINTHEKYSKAYFWSSNANASVRRYAEQKFKDEHPDVCFIKDGAEIRVGFYYKQSCRNVYYIRKRRTNQAWKHQGCKKDYPRIKQALISLLKSGLLLFTY